MLLLQQRFYCSLIKMSNFVSYKARNIQFTCLFLFLKKANFLTTYTLINHEKTEHQQSRELSEKV